MSMHPKLSVGVIALALACVLALTSCSAQRRLVGKWHEVGGAESIEFTADKRVITQTKVGTMNGTYEIREGEQLRIMFSIFGVPTEVRGRFRFEGGRLVLTLEGEPLDGAAKESRYDRVSAATPHNSRGSSIASDRSLAAALS